MLSEGKPLLGSLSTRREHSRPPTNTVWCEEGRGSHHPCGLLEHAPLPTLSSLANAQMQESSTPSTPRSPCLLPLALHPKKAEAGGVEGAGGCGCRGQQSGVQAGNTKLISPSLARCPQGAGLPLALRHRTSYQSGGCAGTGSWRRPCPESERHGERAQTKALRLGPLTANGTTVCGRKKPGGMRIVVNRGGHPVTSPGPTMSSVLRALHTECR